jgi:putative hydrolase of the HAD superfamily
LTAGATVAVVFDFYGTLTAGRTAADQRRVRADQANALGVDPQRFDAELTATVDARFRGAGGSLEGSLRWVARRLGADPSPDQLTEAARIRLAAERTFGEPRPDAAPVLRALHERGMRIGLISDCSAELPTYFAQLPIAAYVDAPVFSFVTGERKPDPANYLQCCEELGVTPPQCVYVGDGGSDELAGARRVGMRAVQLAAPEDAAAVVYDRHLAWDGDAITALPQLLELV